MINEPLIGKNIREARMAKGWPQSKLASATGISATAISAYENDKKRPGLDTLARISNALNTSIDALYFGDASRAFIAKSGTKGELVVNCFYELWKSGVVNSDSLNTGQITYRTIDLSSMYAHAITRLIETLIEFEQRKGTYSSPDVYLDQVFESVANEIDSLKGYYATGTGFTMSSPY